MSSLSVIQGKYRSGLAAIGERFTSCLDVIQGRYRSSIGVTQV
jgi:hypothetical protein